MKIKFNILILTLLATFACKSQQFEKIVLSEQDTSNVYINDGESTELYYLKMIPKTQPIGVVVILPSGGETTEDLI